MTRNLGTTDRALRIIVGLALLAWFFSAPASPWRWLLLIGIAPLATGILGSCGVYRLLGINTRPMRR